MSRRKETLDTGSAPSDSCPVTGLSILRRPEWTDVNFGTEYRVTVSLLGDSILLVQPSGCGGLNYFGCGFRFIKS